MLMTQSSVYNWILTMNELFLLSLKFSNTSLLIFWPWMSENLLKLNNANINVFYFWYEQIIENF